MPSKILPLYIAAALLGVACGADSKYEYCYEGATDRDSQKVSFNLDGETVAGVMEAHYFEREPASGKLKGYLRNDTLYGEFIYEEGGATVYRQILFLQQKEGLIEGFGEWVEVDGKVVYGNVDELEFEHPLMLARTNCR